MKLGTRIFVCYLVIFAACFYYPIHWMIGSLDVRYRESVEEIMVDHATILAAQVAGQMQSGRFDPDQLRGVFHRAQLQSLDVQIYDLHKTLVDSDFYLTDENGRVIADSQQPTEVGADYSQWRDVILTLSGEYGARTSRNDLLDPSTTSLHVSAPVMIDGKISGCLTLVKPTASINAFVAQAKPRVLRAGALSLAAAIVLSFIFSFWLTRPIKRLTQYADGIREGHRVPYPDLGRSEIADLGDAMRKMQVALEGKQYVEEYVQNLTHEIKSPLSAIRGAAELIDDGMPPEKRQRFLDNIRNESMRIGRIVDTMLELASLENRRMQPDVDRIDLQTLLKNVAESKQPMLSQKGIQLDLADPGEVSLTGNSFLLYQAIANLLQNAIDFSPGQSRIDIRTEVGKGELKLSISDQGAGIPDYAIDRIFEKFYSLQRPDTGRKSTGLGLNLVREVAAAHNGSVQLKNRESGGTEAVLVLALTGTLK
jgi:two-component system sensor histidine kinase CreC